MQRYTLPTLNESRVDLQSAIGLRLELDPIRIQTAAPHAFSIQLTTISAGQGEATPQQHKASFLTPVRPLPLTNFTIPFTFFSPPISPSSTSLLSEVSIMVENNPLEPAPEPAPNAKRRRLITLQSGSFELRIRSMALALNGAVNAGKEARQDSMSL